MLHRRFVIQVYLSTPRIAFISIDLQPNDLNQWVFFDMKLYMPTMHTLCYSLDAIAPTRGSGPQKLYPKLPALVSLMYCGQTTVASLVCCCVWMRTLAVSNLCIRWARCQLGYRAPERTYQAIKLVRNRITPLGGRHQRRLVVYTQNSSSIKCTPLSSRFGQIGYHYKLQDSAKKCVLQY